MKHNWIISKNDIKLVKDVCHKQSTHKIYKERIEYNLVNKKIEISKEIFWKSLFTCLLTTQQRSNENSRINLFIKNDYSSINIDQLSKIKNIEKYISSQLKGFGGIRRNDKIANEATTIFNYLNDTNWEILNDIKYLIKNKGNRELERKICNQITNEKKFKGLGPKQSRNLLQMLGVTVYEIPIDSRITDWLNKNNIFPFKVNSSGLSDIEFYCFLNDAIIELCEKSNLKPCLFDAAVFSSKE